jgi:nucleoside-diphosphate-sugar epimerase
MITVTGSSGFIGTNLLAALIAAGEDVVGIDRRPPPTRGPAGEKTPTVLTDLSRPSRAATAVLAAADVVVHLAARPGARERGWTAERQRRRDNVLATDRVLAACAPDAYVIVASSSSVYGGSHGGRACHEDDVLRPIGGYARSKRAVERRAARRDGPTLVVRPFTVVGEHQRPDMALSRWIAAAAAGRPLTLYGDPLRARDLTDVRDVVRALVAAIACRSTGTVNVGTGVSRTLGELAATVRRVVADVPVEPAPVPVPEPDGTLADTARCERLLGLRPRTELDDVVRRQHDAMAAAAPGVASWTGWSSASA